MSTSDSRGGTDDARLTELGYTSEFRRDMSLWANFSLGFTYLSPVVSTYTLFGLALATGGPPMIWSFLLAGAGQFLVALVYGEIVAQYPLAGGIYPWSRRLWGRRWAWMSGWVYLIALLVTITSVAYGAGPYIALLFGFRPTVEATVLCTIGLIVVATLINYAGTRVLSMAAIIGFSAELIGALIVGFWLLFTHRYHGLGVLFDDFGTAGTGSYLPVFLAAGIIGFYQYYGFEACGDTAEEVPNPGKNVPKAMRRTIYIGGAAASFACLTLLLAVPDYQAVISGADPDPLINVLNSAFGTVGARVVMGVVLISFLSCTISLQAAAGRLAYSYARDEMIIGYKMLRKFSHARHVPPYALLLAGIVPALLAVGSLVSTDALTKIVSFAILGIYLAFQMVVLAALRARMKGWQPTGEFQLGRWGMIVNVGALVYGIGAMVNISWPRTPDAPWYDNYIVLLCGVVVVAVGLVYMFTTHHYGRSDAPAGDAIPAERRPEPGREGRA
ncbi:amino acid/polyamine/organocation transporter (APC superfamily) [Saccharopolyspora erythraea NRRL 2338]|uniref:Amino acid permease-associated region n=2 Tax=Saccharopolyspora erythraea TaxID=1836 RepID=A4FHE5_SACEN|nr:APC family permease [Saccharopolyspora erythraea]PFG97166.1 amino acid/polyamine/organocation transporter (APC superfamily) [Saccharopolyspora erythraea NRRL 2338]QRK87368.1 amino acid permease [Saccharopolyspora erythraea]CAM03470.1 amino acid permease-associated region [Saccharopolyspora erythraea NRRL 2338]